VLVVHADDGMDEISITSPTFIAELKHGKVSSFRIRPEDFGYHSASMTQIHASDAAHSLAIIRDVFTNTDGPAKDIVCLNAGAAIYVAGLAETLAAGIEKASQVIASGVVNEKLEQLITKTGNF